jgi:hypothetical protein
MMGLINNDEPKMEGEKPPIPPPVVAADAPEDKHCFPYYDFSVSLGRRFDKSFLFILLVQNFNFGLWILVQLSAQDLFKAYMD